MPSPTLKLFYENLVAAATISTDSTDASFPPANAKSTDLSLVYRSSSDTSVYLQADFGATPSSTIDGMIAIGTNLSDTGTRQFQTDDDSGMASPTGDSTSGTALDTTHGNPLDWRQAIGGRDAIWLPGSDVKERYARWSFNDASAAGGYIEVALLWAGPAWSPGKGYEFDWRRGYTYQRGKVRRTIELTFRWLLAAETDELVNIMNAKAGRGRVYAVVQHDIEESWLAESMLATMEPPLVTVWDSQRRYRQVDVMFVEVTY